MDCYLVDCSVIYFREQRGKNSERRGQAWYVLSLHFILLYRTTQCRLTEPIVDSRTIQLPERKTYISCAQPDLVAIMLAKSQVQAHTMRWIPITDVLRGTTTRARRKYRLSYGYGHNEKSVERAREGQGGARAWLRPKHVKSLQCISAACACVLVRCVNFFCLGMFNLELLHMTPYLLTV